MRHSIVCLCLTQALIISSPAFAKKSHNELSFDFQQVQIRNNDTFDVNTLNYTYYVDGLDSYDGPLAENDFIGRSSRVSLTHTRLRDSSTAESSTILGRFYVDEYNTFALTIGRTTYDLGPSEQNDIMSFGAVSHIDKTSSISFNYSTLEENGDTIFDDNVDIAIIDLSFKKLFKTGYEKYFNLELSLNKVEATIKNSFFATKDTESATTASLVADIYFNKNFSIGYAQSSLIDETPSTDESIDSYTFGFNFYATESLSFRFSHTELKFSGDSDVTDSLLVGLRF